MTKKDKATIADLQRAVTAARNESERLKLAEERQQAKINELMTIFEIRRERANQMENEIKWLKALVENLVTPPK